MTRTYWNLYVVYSKYRGKYLKMIIDYLFKAVIIGHIESNDMMIMVEVSDVIDNSEKN